MRRAQRHAAKQTQERVGPRRHSASGTGREEKRKQKKHLMPEREDGVWKEEWALSERSYGVSTKKCTNQGEEIDSTGARGSNSAGLIET